MNKTGKVGRFEKELEIAKLYQAGMDARRRMEWTVLIGAWALVSAATTVALSYGKAASPLFLLICFLFYLLMSFSVSVFVFLHQRSSLRDIQSFKFLRSGLEKSIGLSLGSGSVVSSENVLENRKKSIEIEAIYSADLSLLVSSVAIVVLAITAGCSACHVNYRCINSFDNISLIVWVVGPLMQVFCIIIFLMFKLKGDLSNHMQWGFGQAFFTFCLCCLGFMAVYSRACKCTDASVQLEHEKILSGASPDESSAYLVP